MIGILYTVSVHKFCLNVVLQLAISMVMNDN